MFASTEPGVSYACRLDGAPGFTPCARSFTPRGLGPGDHVLRVRATDAAGNVDGSPAERSWSIASPPPPAAPIEVELTYKAKARSTATTFRSLKLTGVPAGATVRVACKGRSCPRKSLRIASPNGGTVKLRPFQRRRLRVGTKLTIRVSKDGMTDAVLVLKVRARKPPRVTS